MRFNNNIKVDDMKQKISAKIARHCGRRMSRLFYKFLVSSNLCKYTKMELVGDDDVETMIALYCSFRNVEPMELLAKLVDVEPSQNVTPLNHHSDPYTEVPRVSVDRQSFVHEFDFDVDVGWCMTRGNNELVPFDIVSERLITNTWKGQLLRGAPPPLIEPPISDLSIDNPRVKELSFHLPKTEQNSHPFRSRQLE
ncbi:hypothetical protein J1N35_044680 [Gossypium stocksii]|uniref:Uncharacterized protein n=1 Tax=Gossypium stocksii TaxID=47602 RepID=A0A9D3U9Z3_9ROSI|nr:hypothetical protein J1N35_044680 [Gossypium stocksii]